MAKQNDVSRVNRELDKIVGGFAADDRVARRLRVARRFQEILGERKGVLTNEQLARVKKSGWFSVSQQKEKEFSKRVVGKRK